MKKSVIKTLPKKAKIGIISAVAAVAVICCVVLILVFIKNKSPENNNILVYKKGNEIVVRINDKETTVDKTAQRFRADEENARVFFVVQSSYDDELFDLSYIELKKGELSEEKLVDYAIESDYEISNGDIFYRKYNTDAGAYDACVCNFEDKKIKTFTANVENIYPLDGENCVYFTKIHGTNRVIYKYNGGTSTEFCRDVKSVNFYPDAKNPHVIFERQPSATDTSTELYIAYADSSPEMVCDTADMVFYDNYEADGNLYYFTTSSESVSWSYVISDEYAESDSTMTEPERNDFLAIFGISQAYNEAYFAYQDKLIRDEIRTALDAAVEDGALSVPAYTAFAYSDGEIVKLAENVDPSRVYTVSNHGEPRIVYESITVKENATDMGVLSEIAARSGMDEVINYACEILATSLESKGMVVTSGDELSLDTVALSDYDKSKTQFAFSHDGKNLYAVVRDNQGGRYCIYTNKLNGSSAGETETVSTNVFDYRITEDGIIYLKTDIGKDTGDVFVYDGSKSTKLCNAVNAFRTEMCGDVYFLKDYDELSENPTAEIVASFDGDEISLGENVIVSTFASADGKAAFIRKDGDDTVLVAYSNGETADVCEGASEILLLK